MCSNRDPEKSRLLPPVPTVSELAPPEAKATVNLMDVLLAYTEFDRPYAAPPGVPKERLQILRESFERVLKDPEFAAEAKKLLDWDGTTYLSGEQLQKKIDASDPTAGCYQAGEGDFRGIVISN